MAIKNVWKLPGLKSLLILFSVTIFGARCDSEEPFASQILTFILPLTIQQASNNINISDTLWIIASVPDSLYEYHTKTKYKLPNFDFGQTSIVIRKLINKDLDFSEQPGASAKFGMAVKIGKIDFYGETFVDFKYHYSVIEKEYILRIGLIPKQAGVFCIALLAPQELNYDGIIDLGKSVDGARIIPVYEDLFFPVNNGENNFDLFKLNCLDNTISQPQNYRAINYIQKGTFTFKVVE